MPLILQRIGYYYPFTLPGTALVVVAGALFVHGYRAENDYALLLSLVGIGAAVGAAVLSRLQAARFQHEPVEWISSKPLYAGARGNTQTVRTGAAAPWLFFRVHFAAGGWAAVGRDASLYLRTSSAGSGEDLTLPITLPFSGNWKAAGRFTVRDVFGLSRARFAERFERRLLIQPGLFPESPIKQVNIFGGAEQTSSQKSAELERYYMRDYIPGDRVRDINWKASSRLSQLVTKVSPHTEQQTYTIPIEFRHFRRSENDTVQSLAHLERLKSWLLAFIRKMREEHPNFHFRVKTLSAETVVEADEEVEKLSRELATVWFQRGDREFGFDPTLDEVYLFSTPYDDGLAHAVARYGQAKVHLFRTRFAGRTAPQPVRLSWEQPRRGARNGNGASDADSDGASEAALYLCRPLESAPLPLPWAFRRDATAAAARQKEAGRGGTDSGGAGSGGNGGAFQEHQVDGRIL